MSRCKPKLYVLTVLLIFYSLAGAQTINSVSLLSPTRVNASQLVIYTYESLFNDPYYDLIGNFSEVSGIPRDDIQITRLGDANDIVTRLLLEQSQAQADVVIGIDNALIHLIENKSQLLEKYTPPNINELDSNLIANLDPEKYLLPYDFGIIALYYWNTIINSSSYPEIGNITLDSFLDSDLLSMLIVENPKFSSPGLGFLLWTIAVFGDPLVDFDGMLKQDWRTWWRAANDSLLITRSWGDAFDIFFTPEENRPLMVSYGTSPAYGYCQWGDNTTSAIVTHENGMPNAWLQIEGIGLVKDSPHPANGKAFIDWFLGADLQSELPEHQWMYPANTEANLSTCFQESTIAPESVNRLNDLIPPAMLRQHLAYWQDEWEGAIVETSPGFDTPTTFVIVFLLVIPILIRRKGKKEL
ncbi:MAG: thiamine ABC transporter substrate-binding protein [Candidatus Thorarchaeota archaeon]